jgi:hypothetical protein
MLEENNIFTCSRHLQLVPFGGFKKKKKGRPISPPSSHTPWIKTSRPQQPQLCWPQKVASTSALPPSLACLWIPSSTPSSF